MSSLVCVADYEKRAEEILPKKVFDYFRSGAGKEFTLRHNNEAFNRIRIRPRYLRDVSQRDLKCNILDLKLSMPVGISPTAMQKMAHPDGEIANARAAGEAGSLFILSTLANTSIEEVAKATPKTNKWFQLYIYKNRTVTESLVRRAEAAGFKAIVFTVDAQVYGTKRSHFRNKFKLPPQVDLANFTTEHFNGVRSTEESSGFKEYVKNILDPSLRWKDLEWLANFTKLPVIVKGILTKEDARLAVQYGCRGIIVSNHGGRQMDGVPATIEVLHEIVEAVGDKCVVMMDGGVRQGTDIFKALALGAKMVFMGRPALWGLAVDGQKGVEDILQILRKDLEIVMALSGCSRLQDVTQNMVVHESHYAKL